LIFDGPHSLGMMSLAIAEHREHINLTAQGVV
jgi:hypothetical protein